jgi:LytS/YehU family sensor histidine kinase
MSLAVAIEDEDGEAMRERVDGGSRSRERRCIVSGEVLPESKLIRFVVSPDGEVTPDIAEAPLTPSPPTLGVGLANVRRRLAVLYGEAGVLTAGPRESGGFAATIALPLERR